MVLSLPAHQPNEGENGQDGGHEATAAGADLVDPCTYFLHELVVFVAHGYVLIGTEFTCKGGMGIPKQRTECRIEYRVQITEGRSQ